VPSAKKGPRLSLVQMTPVPERIAAARMAELTPWVEVFREQYSSLWPVHGTGVQGPAGSARRRYPWPGCWALHASLVTELRCLKRWTEAVEEGDLETAEAMGGGFNEWIHHVREVAGEMVQEIAQICMAGGVNFHRSTAVPLREQPGWESLRLPSPPSQPLRRPSPRRGLHRER